MIIATAIVIPSGKYRNDLQSIVYDIFNSTSVFFSTIHHDLKQGQIMERINKC
ncbi:hypothetical protein SAMN05192529_11543 [Arachidicoccus rhizosphaerae]|uniref:Uncharacterized protein n=1 Tax=Arachidicoccus rhizosphaerae TaxID=551991 RepID=A0A1H4AKJ5_9BACT|nr:hypothetical protein SAMN05192529_11543 [Arachidicoccus rhizosphaerae]